MLDLFEVLCSFIVALFGFGVKIYLQTQTHAPAYAFMRTYVCVYAFSSNCLHPPTLYNTKKSISIAHKLTKN